MQKQRSIKQLIASHGPEHDLPGFACCADQTFTEVLLRYNLCRDDVAPAAAVALRFCEGFGLAVGAWCGVAS